MQCVKSLWLKKYKKDVLSVPNSSAEAMFETGNRVGELACGLFLHGKEVLFRADDYEAMLETTKKFIADGVKNIYEASFSYDGVFAAIDILHINDDRSVEIYEVKSSTEVKSVYLDDVSIQYYILQGLGYTIKSANVVHINNSYVRDDELEIDKLFSIVDVTDEVLLLQYNIKGHLKNFVKILQEKEKEPNIDIGLHCLTPYECDAKEYCWRHIPEYSVFNISRLRSDKKFEMYYKNIIKFEDIEDISQFSDSQQVRFKVKIFRLKSA